LLASQTHAPIACTECHVVPEQVYSKGHFDDVQGAHIEFGALARQEDQEPIYDRVNASCSTTYCHHKYAPDNVPKWQAPKDSTDAWAAACAAAPAERGVLPVSR
jgi:hypothetical protein